MVEREARLHDPGVVHVARIAAPDRAGEAGRHILAKAQHLRHFPHGAARTVMDDGRGDPGAMTALAFVDILPHLPAPPLFPIEEIGRRSWRESGCQSG